MFQNTELREPHQGRHIPVFTAPPPGTPFQLVLPSKGRLLDHFYEGVFWYVSSALGYLFPQDFNHNL